MYSATIPAPGIGGVPSDHQNGQLPCRIEQQEFFAPFPEPFFHKPRRDAVLSKDEPHVT